MKPHAWTLWLVVGLLGTVGALFISRGWAEETYDVQKKRGEVSNEEPKKYLIDHPGEEEPVSPQSVTTVGTTITIISKTFRPPGPAWPPEWCFKEFGTRIPWKHVDIETEPSSLPATANPDWPSQIKITLPNVPETAAMYPLKSEGNLMKIKVSPSGGEKEKEEWHWSAKIAKVKLYWETYDQPGDNEPIDAHPAEPANGGWRIFPGKKVYNDTAENAAKRRYVFAVVEFAEGADLPDKMYYRVWDVDDPSSDTAPIDKNGAEGGDNLGKDEGEQRNGWHVADEDEDGKHISDVTMGHIMRFVDDTGTQGEESDTCAAHIVKCAVRVGMQPGDNWRFAVAWGEGAKARLEAMTQAQADTCQPPVGVVESEMLTTWRKLHLELDSMAAVPAAGAEKNFVAGSISGVTGTGPYTATTDQNLLDTDMYEKGTLVKGGNNYTVKTGAGANTTGANSQVVVTTDPGTGAFTSLKDDDTKTMPDLPDTGKVDSIFAACYIKHATDTPGGSNDVNFDLNVGGALTMDADIDLAVARGSAGDEADDFWVVYLLGGYQAGHDEDFDPDLVQEGVENAVGGHTRGGSYPVANFAYQAAIIYLETIGDRAAKYGQNATTIEQQIVVQEVGHQVLESANHTANTIMQSGLPVGPAYEKFSDADIATIRGTVSSPGK